MAMLGVPVAAEPDVVAQPGWILVLELEFVLMPDVLELVPMPEVLAPEVFEPGEEAPAWPGTVVGPVAPIVPLEFIAGLVD